MQVNKLLQDAKQKQGEWARAAAAAPPAPPVSAAQHGFVPSETAWTIVPTARPPPLAQRMPPPTAYNPVSSKQPLNDSNVHSAALDL